MATKEKKSTVTKNLKDGQAEKEKASETPKAKRSRKSLADSTKSSPEQKSPRPFMRKKRSKESSVEESKAVISQKRLRRSAADQEEPKTPPGGQKVKKAHLEKELGDLLENATGRNTPLLPRNRKINEKEEEGTESTEGLVLMKGKVTDDDNMSVKSLSVLPRSKRVADDDDVSSVKSVPVRTRRGGEVAEDDAASVASGVRSLVGKQVRKKKCVLAAIAVKKKIFTKRGRPKKLEDVKGKPLEGKKMGKIKGADKALADKQKRVVKKPLKFQNKIKEQSRIQKLRSANLKKAKLKLAAKKQKESNLPDQSSKERLIDNNVAEVEKKKKVLLKKGKKSEESKVSTETTTGGEKQTDVYFFSETEPSVVTPKGRPKVIKLPKEKATPKKSEERKKKRRESGIHFETTRSPEDSSVIIVQPRLGPKIRGQRLKPILPKTEETVSKMPKDVLPNVAMANFNQISNSLLLQSIQNTIPNFNLFAANPALLRNLNSNSIDIRPAGDSSKVSNNEIIVTPSGIVLSGSRLVSPNSQHPMCFNGSSPNFPTETTNGEAVSTSKDGGEIMPGLTYQGSTSVIQPQTTPNTAIFLKRPEAMSTSLISATSGGFVLNSSGNNNSGLKVKVSNPPVDSIVSEKALEGDAMNRFKITPTNSNGLPSIPVAKSVNDLIMLKKKSNTSVETQVTEDLLKKTDPIVNGKPCAAENTKSIDAVLKESKVIKKHRKRELRNVRHMRDSGSELTFSDPETSSFETDEVALFKTISYERLNKPARIVEPKSKMLLQLGSEPIKMSDAVATVETASMLLVTKKEKIEDKLDNECESPKIKGAIDVCRFSKENEEALKEFGLDSDLDQSKPDTDSDSPIKKPVPSVDVTAKARIKEEVDNVLKEMPIRRISNCPRKSEPFKINSGRMDHKSPLLHKNEYLTLSPSKPPTVIDKLLEKNKSLKKAEEEGKFQNAIRNLSDSYEVVEVKPRRNLRETRTRKFSKTMESRRVAHKRLASGGKVYERRGSNPEIYSGDYLNGKNQVANENVPLRRVTDPGDGKFQRRASIDFDSLQKVLDRRCSLPAPAEELSKSLDDVNKIKTENVKTIIVGTNKPLTTKNQGEVQRRVINIETSSSGLKKGKNLLKEIGLEMETDPTDLVNGERRTSTESYNSDSEALQKLVDGLSEEKVSNEVPYFREKSCKKETVRLSTERKSLEEKETKNVVIEESPEDLVTKETILSALGLQSLKAAAESAQKKKDSQANQQSNCQTDSGGYTGTLKAVIKIQRQEKKGNSKSPIKMVYKASSSSSSVSGQLEDSNNLEDADTTSKEEPEENNVEDNKNGNGKAKSLVIPEKASSFSIHPGRMCSDVCTYCFGKFGLLDTPCHIAQLKDADKRRNILATEVHLTADSCLCDACFRHVDKKCNCPTFTDKKQEIRKRPVRKQSCIVQNCNSESQHTIKRKLFLKLKKSVGRKVILDAGKLDKLQPGQSLTFCNRHIYWIDYFMSCGICKKRLTSVNMYRVTSEVLELNAALSSDEIPAILTENRFLCKICNCFASIRLKCKDPNELSSTHRQFYETCRKRILKCHGMEVPDSEVEGDGKNNTEHKRKSKKSSKPTATVTNENSKSDNDMDASMEEMQKTMESEKDLSEVSHMNIPPKANGNLDFGGVSITPSTTEVNPTQIHVKLGNLNIGALGNLNIGQDVRHGGARGGDIQCFPTETELALRAHFDLQPSSEDESAKTPRKGFDKCTATIQFNAETKNLFYNLQMPYGNQSSFFRHLILLEKYFRSGDLVISRNADPKAVSYISSVQNRIRSYEGVHTPPKKTPEVPPSLSILPQPVKTEPKPSVMPSRPFTLTPMPSSSTALKNSPLSQIQATVQNIQPSNPSQGIMTSLLKSSVQTSKFSSHPKPEVSITSVSADGTPPVRLGKASVLTSKIQENLWNLASKNQVKKPNQARAVILNRTVGGQKQSLVQVTTGGKTIHLTLSQFRRIQQMQMKKKQYLEHQAKMQKGKEEQVKTKAKSSEDNIVLKNLSPELEIQEVKQKTNGSDVFPLISEVRSLAGDEASWTKKEPESNDFPKIPKTLSVSVTKVCPPDYSVKEQSVEPVD